MSSPSRSFSTASMPARISSDSEQPRLLAVRTRACANRFGSLTVFMISSDTTRSIPRGITVDKAGRVRCGSAAPSLSPPLSLSPKLPQVGCRSGACDATWSISAIVLWEIEKLWQLGRIIIEQSRFELALQSVRVWPIDVAVARPSTRLDSGVTPRPSGIEGRRETAKGGRRMHRHSCSSRSHGLGETATVASRSKPSTRAFLRSRVGARVTCASSGPCLRSVIAARGGLERRGYVRERERTTRPGPARPLARSPAARVMAPTYAPSRARTDKPAAPQPA